MKNCMSKSSSHGLTLKELQIIQEILRPYGNLIERVALFGSRATGHYKEYSDIDLVLYGEGLTQKVIDRLWTLFSESSLIYKVDLVAYNLITHSSFKAHIDRCNQTLFEGF